MLLLSFSSSISHIFLIVLSCFAVDRAWLSRNAFLISLFFDKRTELNGIDFFSEESSDCSLSSSSSEISIADFDFLGDDFDSFTSSFSSSDTKTKHKYTFTRWDSSDSIICSHGHGVMILREKPQPSSLYVFSCFVLVTHLSRENCESECIPVENSFLFCVTVCLYQNAVNES